MTRAYLDGKRVAKEEISNYEITNENVKRMLSEMLTRKNKSCSK